MLVLLFIIGSCFGSFYLVIGKRLPKNENAVNSRSHCDNCDHILSWWELVPIFSYVILGGKCHKCKKHISLLNPLVEIAVGGLFAFGFWYYGFSYNFYIFLIIASLMMIIFISDFGVFNDK